MSTAIWKKELVITDAQQIQVPYGAEFLDAQTQRGVLSVWFLCSPDVAMMDVIIRIYGTGNPMPDAPGNYISTVQQGSLVWHVFWEGS